MKSKSVKIIEVDNGMVVITGQWGKREFQEMLVKGYKISIRQENIPPDTLCTTQWL